MIAIDCEMSGLDPKVHSILSIGALDLDNPENQFYGECRLGEGKTFDPISLSINGFTQAEITGDQLKTQKELITEFFTWLSEVKEKTLVGQNLFLDREFLNTAFVDCGIPFQFHYRVVDIHSTAVSVFLSEGRDLKVDEVTGQIRMSLDTIASKLGIGQEPRPHNALTGAKFNAEVFSRLVYKKNLLKEFKHFPVL